MADMGFEGLERFLHMVEGRLGRWGRPIGTGVLLIALLAFTLFCINHIVNDGIIPSWNVIKTIKDDPQSSASIVYQFLAQGAAILFWFVIVPVMAAFLIGSLVAAYKYKNTISGLKRRLELAKDALAGFSQFSVDMREIVATTKHGENNPQKVVLVLKKVLDAFNRYRPILEKHEKELKELHQTSSKATPSKSSAAKQANKNVA